MQRHDWHADMQRAVDEFGPPMYGLAGPLAREGVLNGHGGKPCDEVTLLYRPPGARLEVTSAKRPLDRTDCMVTAVLARSQMAEPTLPFTVTIDERLVLIPVSQTPTQFHVVESSTGHWAAAGSFGERHLSVTGTPGVVVANLALTPVVLDFST